MSYCRSFNKENEDRLSSFGQRLQSLSETFYSTILEDPKDKKVIIKSAEELESLKTSDYEDFTFDELSSSRMTRNENFSFTFHSIDQPKVKTSLKHQPKRINGSSTPYSVREDNFIKKSEDETIVVEQNACQPILIGYYPIISYQPVSLPPNIYLSNEQIQSQLNHFSTLNKVTSIKKV